MSCKLQQKAGLIIGLFLFLLSFSYHAAFSRLVTEEGVPTEIHVVGVILDVDQIDSSDKSFTLNFYSGFRCRDPRSAMLAHIKADEWQTIISSARAKMEEKQVG